MAYANVCTLRNRTKVTLECKFDGKIYVLAPGDNHGFPLAAVPFAMAQNPLMGSQDPYRPSQFESLVGVVGNPKHKLSPIKQSKAIELFDRTKMQGQATQAVQIMGDPVRPDEGRVAGIETEIDGSAYAGDR